MSKLIISPCDTCSESIVQMDLFDSQKEEIVGCKNLTKLEWDRGLDHMTQTNCPLNKKIRGINVQ